MAFEIAVRKSVPVEQCEQCPSVRIFYSISFSPPRKVKVEILPVDGDNTCRILRLLHTAFYLQGGDAVLNEFRQQIEQAQILRAQKVSLYGLSLFRSGLIAQSARLCAPSAIPAAPAELAREQALSGIADAERSVDKCFHLESALLMDPAKLVKCHFTGGNDAAHTLSGQKGRAAGACHRHLCARMDREIRKASPDHPEHSEILDQNSVQPPLIIRPYKIREQRELFLLQQGVDREIDLHSAKVRIIDQLFQLLLFRIFGVCTGTEL